MSDHEDPEFGRLNDPNQPDGALLPSPDRASPRLSLPALIAPTRADSFEPRASGESARARKRPGRQAAWIGSAAAAAALFASAALWVAANRTGEAAAVAERPDKTVALARTIDALSARLSALESAKPGDQLTELRRSIADIRSSLASSHELGGALADLSQRVEKLDRDESAKVEKLGERVDHETAAKTAELAQRIEMLEKKAAAVAEASAETATPAKPSSAPPKLAAGADTDGAGAADRPRPVLRGYIVLGARDDVALVEGRYGELAVRPGDVLPGAGRVERIARQRGAWVVVTEQGLIPSGY